MERAKTAKNLSLNPCARSFKYFQIIFLSTKRERERKETTTSITYIWFFFLFCFSVLCVSLCLYLGRLSFLRQSQDELMKTKTTTTTTTKIKKKNHFINNARVVMNSIAFHVGLLYHFISLEMCTMISIPFSLALAPARHSHHPASLSGKFIRAIYVNSFFLFRVRFFVVVFIFDSLGFELKSTEKKRDEKNDQNWNKTCYRNVQAHHQEFVINNHRKRLFILIWIIRIHPNHKYWVMNVLWEFFSTIKTTEIERASERERESTRDDLKSCNSDAGWEFKREIIYHSVLNSMCPLLFRTKFSSFFSHRN